MTISNHPTNQDILDLERILPECDALYRTVILLHRSRDSFEQNEVMS